MTSTQTAAAGWYPDPQMSGTQRYWTGTGWSEHVAPLPQAAVPPAVGVSDDGGLIAAGFIFAVLLPLIGFIIGIVLMAKSKAGAGVVVILASLFATIFYFNMLSSSNW